MDKYIISLKKYREIDKIVGGTKVGPHKSDYVFFVDKNYPASQLSTGQQKTVILLIIFAQSKFLIDIFKINPVLLFDDHNKCRRTCTIFTII